MLPVDALMCAYINVWVCIIPIDILVYSIHSSVLYKHRAFQPYGRISVCARFKLFPLSCALPFDGLCLRTDFDYAYELNGSVCVCVCI